MLPHPPDTLEAGPTSPAPGANYFWIPGCWIWQVNAYAWRPGYWYAGQANWVWVPDHYSYTPAGSIFVAGYWDYPLLRRGLLFAPVWWPRHHFGYAGWYYRPYSIVNTSLLLTSLFIHGHHHHYWYGHGHWRHDHFHPWWDARWRGHGYDPLWAYHRWHDGHNGPDWEYRMRQRFEQGQRNINRNLGGAAADNLAGGERGPGEGRPAFRPGSRPLVDGGRTALVRDVRQVTRDGDGPVRVRPVNETEMQLASKKLDAWKQIRQVRARAEAAGPTVGSVRLGDRGQGGANVGGVAGNIGGRPVTRRAGAGASGQTQVGPNGAATGRGVVRRGSAGPPSGQLSGEGAATGQASAVQAEAGQGGPVPGGVARRSGYRGSTYRLPGAATPRGGTTTVTAGEQGAQTGSPGAFRRGGVGVGSAPSGGVVGGPQPRRLYGSSGGTPSGGVQQALPGGQAVQPWSGSQPGGSWSARVGSAPSGTQLRQFEMGRGGLYSGRPIGQAFQGAPQFRQGGGVQIPSGGGQPAARGYRPQMRANIGGGAQFNRGSGGGGTQFNRGSVGGQPTARAFRPSGRANFGGGAMQLNRGGGGGGRAAFGGGGGGGGGGRRGGD
jgi:hypothetical protein